MRTTKYKTGPLTPIQEFFKTESSSGIVLLVTTMMAFFLANSPMRDIYFGFFQMHLNVGFEFFSIDKPLLLWVNDGLMALFFLLIGLEIKRELKYGELSDAQSAVVPFVAAIGGAVIPGLIFFLFNSGTDYSQGWAIAIATDIAFAIGILSLLGSKVPVWAKVFLTAVAIVDDLIAVLVIALFYTANINIVALLVAAGCVLVLIVMNTIGTRKLGLYLLVGFVLWVAFLKSGMHATIAGVVLGITIPASRKMSMESVIEQTEAAITLLRHAYRHEQDESRETALNFMDEVVEESESPLHRLEHALHPWVAFGIIPIFAFANAGIAINAELVSEAFSSTLTWGIILGLFAGKQLGIFLSVYLMKLMGLSSFPNEKGTWRIFYGLACLSGVGFTMSLFIAGLSFSSMEVLEFAKIGIIVGSLLSGLLGYSLLQSAIRSRFSFSK